MVWEDGDIFAQRIVDIPGPEAPSNLSATSLTGRRIRLDWTVSPSTNVSHYNIYYDSGTGVIDYAVRLSSVSASSSTFTTDPLVAGVTYKFGVRTVDDNNVEELNTNVVASATALDSVSSAVQAAIKVPQSGRKVTGNRLTVVAEIVQGNLSSVKSVRFQYRNAISTSNPWVDIVAATTQHPNPDLESPYFVHWDVSSFAEGNYELRAVATNTSDGSDPSPPTIFITIDHADPESEEIVSGSGIRKRQRVNGTVPNTVQVGDPQSAVVTNVTVPANALSSSSTTLRLLTAPSSLPQVPGSLTSPDIFTEITLENGQTTLSNSQQATITIDYPDANGDGLVDDSGLKEDRLALYRFNTGTNRWDKLAGSVDTLSKRITAQTPGFSVFGLFAPAAADLSDVLVYPVPWVPNDGKDDNGKPFNPSDSTSGIIFDNLTPNLKIEVFTVTGERVWERSPNGSSGRVQWDVKNSSGREVASGGYFAVITDTSTGNKVTRKIAVIR
ncbi:MAG: fibronectin type III domain-containing protein [Elusimicrobia bacterium]|nr:fibronectin type III domain-containing protein [Elusimicrobiota bacterium]